MLIEYHDCIHDTNINSRVPSETQAYYNLIKHIDGVKYGSNALIF